MFLYSLGITLHTTSKDHFRQFVNREIKYITYQKIIAHTEPRGQVLSYGYVAVIKSTQKRLKVQVWI